MADSAISGPLKGKAGTPELCRELVNGDFKKKVVMKFLGDVSTDQIRDAFRDSLKEVGARRTYGLPTSTTFARVRSA